MRAMINVGRNPTFGQEYLSIEVHLLDFEADLYGEQLRVHFLRRIRDEKKFTSAEELRIQLEMDRKISRKLPLPSDGWTGLIFGKNTK